MYDEPQYALLIDADNIHQKYFDTVMDESLNKGSVTIRRIYGDVKNPCIGDLREVLLKYAISPMQQFSYTNGKNSTDIYMAIDAMDILYTHDIDGFIIVSSDSDFTRLAMRLRESGKDVIGMGKRTTPQPFIKACNEFKFIDINDRSNPETNNYSYLPRINLRKEIIEILKNQFSDSENVNASDLGSAIRKKYPDFDPKHYGFDKTVALLESLEFKIVKVDDPNNKAIPGAKIAYIVNSGWKDD